MAFKMKGSAFKLNNVATKSALAMKSPLEQTEASALKQQLTVNGRVMKIKGKEKKGNQRYPSEHLIPGRAQWIRDNFGRNLSEKRKKEAQISYFNEHAPKKQPVVEKTEPIYYGEEKVKETKYPTNKDISGQFGINAELKDKNLGEEVWDPTLNGGEGGYIRRKAADGNSEIPNETDNYSWD